MARSQLQRRKAREAADEAAKVATLAAHNRRAGREAGVSLEAVHAAVQGYGPHVRPMASFTRRMRTRDQRALYVAVAEHLYKRYTTPKFLTAVWATSGRRPPLTPRQRQRPRPADEQTAEERERFGVFATDTVKAWYVCVAGGGSLYKAHLSGFMTRREVHAFLTCPFDFSLVQAMTWALARSWTGSTGRARRLAQSKVAHRDLREDYWREALRWFVTHDVQIREINDICDFLTEHQPRGFSLRGRTLGSMRQIVDQWHRTMARAQRMGDATWEGFPLEDAAYDNVGSLCREAKGQRFDWTFTQIRSSRALAEEGSAMHHCVFAYQPLCLEGRSSIWSVRVRRAARGHGSFERALTLELLESGAIVQIRGYANRPARDYEMEIVRRWAAENGLRVTGGRW
jgi:hypothetical protein